MRCPELLRILLCCGIAVIAAAVEASPPAAPAAKTASAPGISIARHHPCNLFAPGAPVVLTAALQRFPDGAGEARAVLRDGFGREVLRRSWPVEVRSGSASVELAFGMPGNGWYEVAVDVEVAGAAAHGAASLGVAELTSLSAAESRAKDHRFGIKWWSGVADKTETVEMMAALGMQWTRIIQNESGEMGTVRMLTEYPINGIIKVERFPKELFDSERYGDLATWERSYGRGAWALKTLPRQGDYQEWLRGQLAGLPADQNVFEIWNEPWDKMGPQDFATLCQWIVPVIRSIRPQAIIGPNLVGSTAAFDYDAKVVEAGGMRGMDMVCLHPYVASEDRAWLRGYRAWIEEKTGKPIGIYITEYGSHSTPEGPAQRSELEQARRVVRQSLALYAEGVQVLLPHWVGQSERNPTYLEDWFGFIRRNQEPKPVLLAHAACARLIDGSRWLGDLWYGPGVDAMLFLQDGIEVLALATRDEDKEIEIEPGAATVQRFDLFGGQKLLAAGADGKLHLAVGPDPIYLRGTALAKLASRELRPDRFPSPAKPPRGSRTIHRFAQAPVCDGQLGEWTGATQLAMQNAKVNGDDASGMASLAWDAANLYLAVEMRDNELLNVKPRAKLYLQDSIELFLSTAARDEGKGYGPHDFQVFIAPTSGEGKPIVGLLTDRQAGTVVDIPGAAFRFIKTPVGWTGEIAIPWATFGGAAPTMGTTMACELRVNDADTSHERWKLDPLDGNVAVEDPSAWSLLRLAE